MIHHRDTEGTENRVFAHSREIPRMGKLLARLWRRWIHVIARSIRSMEVFEFSDNFDQSLLPQAEKPLSFAGISRQMKDLHFSVFSVSLW